METMKTVIELIDGERARLQSTEGKKFSTYYEGHAKITASFDRVMENVKKVAQGMDIMWEKVKEEEVDEDFEDVRSYMRTYALEVLLVSVVLVAQLDKLKDGVVHPPKEV